MKILILSFNYPPDIGPGALRASSIVDALLEVSDNITQIDVLTTMPNRYHTLTVNAASMERINPVFIQRITLPKHQNGTIDQARAFMAFAQGVYSATKGKKWDIIVATSSRLMTAALAAWLSKHSKTTLYLDIRDLFTDTIGEVLANNFLRVLLPIFKTIEYYSFRAANQLNAVSAGFIPHINKVAPHLKPTILTNGIDDTFLNTDFSSKFNSEKPLIVYAGNIGDGQGLQHIIPQAAQKLNKSFRFRIIGDGGRKKILKRLLMDEKIENVELIDPIPRKELFSHYREADILFLHLNDFKAFRKVLPSKIFEYAATEKPILAGVSGYASKLLCEQIPGVEIFNPCDSRSMSTALSKLMEGPVRINRSSFCKKYSRKKIMRELAKNILSTSNQS